MKEYLTKKRTISSAFAKSIANLVFISCLICVCASQANDWSLPNNWQITEGPENDPQKQSVTGE